MSKASRVELIGATVPFGAAICPSPSVIMIFCCVRGRSLGRASSWFLLLNMPSTELPEVADGGGLGSGGQCRAAGREASSTPPTTNVLKASQTEPGPKSFKPSGILSRRGQDQKFRSGPVPGRRWTSRGAGLSKLMKASKIGDRAASLLLMRRELDRRGLL